MNQNQHNGWTNWETWEAFGILTSTEETTLTLLMQETPNEFCITALTFLNSYLLSLDCSDHMDFRNINFHELYEAIKEQ